MERRPMSTQRYGLLPSGTALLLLIVTGPAWAQTRATGPALPPGAGRDIAQAKVRELPRREPAGCARLQPRGLAGGRRPDDQDRRAAHARRGTDPQRIPGAKFSGETAGSGERHCRRCTRVVQGMGGRDAGRISTRSAGERRWGDLVHAAPGQHRQHVLGRIDPKSRRDPGISHPRSGLRSPRAHGRCRPATSGLRRTTRATSASSTP